MTNETRAVEQAASNNWANHLGDLCALDRTLRRPTLATTWPRCRLVGVLVGLVCSTRSNSGGTMHFNAKVALCGVLVALVSLAPTV